MYNSRRTDEPTVGWRVNTAVTKGEPNEMEMRGVLSSCSSNKASFQSWQLAGSQGPEKPSLHALSYTALHHRPAGTGDDAEYHPLITGIVFVLCSVNKTLPVAALSRYNSQSQERLLLHARSHEYIHNST